MKLVYFSFSFSFFLFLFFFFFLFSFSFLYGNTFVTCFGLVVLTLVLRSSLFQKAKSRIQLTRRIARGGCCCCWSDASALLMKRAVSQLTLHPSVEVRRMRDVSGGSWR